MSAFIAGRNHGGLKPIKKMMKWNKWIAVSYLVGMELCITQVLAQTLNQTIPLQAGWNAVYLELDPNNRTPAMVFSNLPIASVWTYKASPSTAQFVQTQSEANFNTNEWMVYFPASRPESFRTTLYTVLPQRAYLIRCTNAATWTVSGQVVWRATDWIPDQYNLKGFAIDPAHPPTFKGFFQNSKAHFDSFGDQLSGIYRLQSGGQWASVSNNDSMKRGECYWVMCNGASDFSGSLEIQLPGGNLLDFGSTSDSLLIKVRNRGSAALKVTISDRQTTTPLSYGSWNAEAGNTWISLSKGLTLTLNPGDANNIRLSIDRAQFSTPTYASILDINGDNGIQIVLGVQASKYATGNGNAGALAGLWIGDASIEEVSEPANINDPTKTTPVKNPLTMRLIIHVDNSGIARLLKEVTQMMKPPEYTTSSSGMKQQSAPAKAVLLTEKSLFNQYQGSVLKDGKLVGRRWSTAAYDFESSSNSFLVFSGSFVQGGTLSTQLSIPSSLSTNPFLHQYHPDHDNKDEQFKGFKEEAYSFSRQMTLTVGVADSTELGSGYRVVSGIYQEKVKGIHRSDINLKGTFKLQRVVNLGVLNAAE